jgi:hypothetical protein
MDQGQAEGAENTLPPARAAYSPCRAAYGRNGKPITQRQVATLLSDFTTPSGAKIKPRNIRTDGKVTKGYARGDFADAFERYLSPSPLSQSATPLQTNNISELKEKSSVTAGCCVPDENEPNLLNSNACSGVADRNPPPRDERGWCSPQGPPAGQMGRTCAQCRGRVDGKERQFAIGDKTAWLHPECKRFYLEEKTLPW